MMRLTNRHIMSASSVWFRSPVRKHLLSPNRSFLSGVNKFLDEKLPTKASPDFGQPALMVVPVILTHGVLGALLSYPVIGEALSRELGVVGSVAGDWDIIESTLPLSLGFMISGLVSSLFGGAIAEIGPRKALLGSAVCIGGGLALSAVGAYTHSLPLLYFGFGTSVGAGAGLSYASPMQTLMTWFPQNKGVCGGIAVSAMGLGAVLSREGLEMVLRCSARLPEYLGPASSFDVAVGKGQSLSVEVGGAPAAVVEVLSEHVAAGLPALQEGLYLLGSGGSTGAAGALALMSAVSVTALTASAAMIRTPPEEYAEDKSDLFVSPLFRELTARDQVVRELEQGAEEVNIFTAARSRNFHVLGAMLACTATSGLGLLTLSEPILLEAYSGAFPDLMTRTFLDNHLLCLSAAGIFGAGFWSALSDFVGSRKALVLMYFISAPAFLALPYCTSLALESGSSLPVFLGVGAGAVAVSSLGGVLAVMPAYCSELYGSRNVTAIQGGLLAYTTLAATFAPYLYVKLHSLAESAATAELVQKVSPEDFQQAFGSSFDAAQGLLQSGSLSLAGLHGIAPAGSVDPTPYLYDTTLYSFAGLMTIAALSNSLVLEPGSRAAGAAFSPHVPLPEKVRRGVETSGKQFTDRRKKTK